MNGVHIHEMLICFSYVSSVWSKIFSKSVNSQAKATQHTFGYEYGQKMQEKETELCFINRTGVNFR